MTNIVLLSVFSLSPYSFDVSPSCTDVPQITHDSIPIGAIPILATSTAEYIEAVSRTISAANAAYQGIDFRVCPTLGAIYLIKIEILYIILQSL